MNLRLIRPEEVESLWPLAAPRLAPAVALTDGETTLDLLLQELVLGERRLVLITEEDSVVVAVVLTLITYPCKRACRVSFAGGSRLDEWCDTGLHVVENIARELGADEVQISGRRGWAKRFRRHNYKERLTIISKSLKE